MVALLQPMQAQPSNAAETPLHPFDRPTWQRATEGLDYGAIRRPRKKENDQAQTPAREKSGKDRRSGEQFSLDGAPLWLRAFLKLLLYLGAAFLLFLLLRGLLGLERPPRNRRVPKAEPMLIDLERMEEDLTEHDLPAYIQQAISAGRYDLAVRLHYLSVLKELSARRLIHWKKDKTNNDYLREMRQSGLYPPFSALTQRYEQIWYGKQLPAVEDYGALELQFRQFTTRLGHPIAYEAEP